MGGERRPPDDPGEAEEHDRDAPGLPEEGGQAVANMARGGVAGAAASGVLVARAAAAASSVLVLVASACAASGALIARAAESASRLLVSRAADASAAAIQIAPSGVIALGAPTSCAFAGATTRVNPGGGPALPLLPRAAPYVLVLHLRRNMIIYSIWGLPVNMLIRIQANYFIL